MIGLISSEFMMTSSSMTRGRKDLCIPPTSQDISIGNTIWINLNTNVQIYSAKSSLILIPSWDSDSKWSDTWIMQLNLKWEDFGERWVIIVFNISILFWTTTCREWLWIGQKCLECGHGMILQRLSLSWTAILNNAKSLVLTMVFRCNHWSPRMNSR